MSKIVVFVTEWCNACHSQLPKIRSSANKLGLSIEVVDIDRCSVKHKDTCARVDFVPHLELDGRAISVEKLESMVSKR